MTLLPTPLPDYVVINDLTSQKRDILRLPAKEVTFPLNDEVREALYCLEAKFDQQESVFGIAAPQIGYCQRIIVFALEEEEDLKNFYPDLTDTLPKSIWINPSFKPLSLEQTSDWEACFSVKDLVGNIPRFTEISYEAWTPEGKKVQGNAKGLLARIIQHEIDHVNGKLFIDYVREEELITRDELRKRSISN